MYRDYFGQLYISVSHVQQDPLQKRLASPRLLGLGKDTTGVVSAANDEIRLLTSSSRCVLFRRNREKS